jgi:hypothetical protein
VVGTPTCPHRCSPFARRNAYWHSEVGWPVKGFCTGLKESPERTLADLPSRAMEGSHAEEDLLILQSLPPCRVTSPVLRGGAQIVRAGAGFHSILGPSMLYCAISWEQLMASPFFCASAQLIEPRLTLPAISCNDNDQHHGFWSVGVAVVRAIVPRDVRDERPFGFLGIFRFRDRPCCRILQRRSQLHFHGDTKMLVCL